MLSSPAFAELPLAIFTTLAPIGAGSYLAIAILLLSTSLEYEALRKVDRACLVPLIVTIAGFVASIFHLANPLHGVWAFSHVGHSPLSNEIAVGAVFLILAAAFTILALAGKLSVSARRPFSVVVAAAAIVFAVFTGLAYHMETIPSWSSVFVPIQTAGFAIAGGAVFGGALLALAGVGGRSEAVTANLPLLVAAIIGAALAVVGVLGQLADVMALENALVKGPSLVMSAAPFAVVGLVLVALSVVLQWVALRVRPGDGDVELVVEEVIEAVPGAKGVEETVYVAAAEAVQDAGAQGRSRGDDDAAAKTRACPLRTGACPCSQKRTVLAVIAMAVVVVGVFCCRLAFYAVAMSVGLTLF